jgi:hypothetical protein
MQCILEQFGINPMAVCDLQKFHHAAPQILAYGDDFLLAVIRNSLERGIREGLYRNNLNVDIISRFRLQS